MKNTKKHVWPWVFFNRFVGYSGSEKSLSEAANNIYFKKTKGMDIYGQSGALNDFIQIWRLSLRLAKKMKSPGIVIDPETYNNYKSYQVSYLAQQLDKPADEIILRLKQVGRELAVIADKEYPDATLWFLFTALGSPMRSFNPIAPTEYRTVTYIIEGMLQKMKETGSKLQVVSGGEVSLGYCYRSLDDMTRSIDLRSEKYFSSLLKYPNLKLGATIAPWNKREEKTAWMSKGKCKSSEVKNMNEFKPLLKKLLDTYGYVWIYGAMAAGYNPFDSSIYPAYNKAIGDAKSESR